MVLKNKRFLFKKEATNEKGYPTLSNSYPMKVSLMQRMKIIQLLIWTEDKGKQEQTSCKMSCSGQNGDVDRNIFFNRKASQF